MYVDAFDAKYCSFTRVRTHVSPISLLPEVRDRAAASKITHQVRRLELLDVAGPPEDRLLVQDVLDRLVRRAHWRVKEAGNRRNHAVSVPTTLSVTGSGRDGAAGRTRARWC